MSALKKSKSVLKEFRAFALRANAIDLAIGVTVGAAFTAVVTALVQGLFTPVISALAGNANFASLAFHINKSTFKYGEVINAFISLLVIAAVMFVLVVKPPNALRRNLGFDADEAPTLAKCPACLTEIPLAARRCAYCTEVLPEGWSTPQS